MILPQPAGNDKRIVFDNLPHAVYYRRMRSVDRVRQYFAQQGLQIEVKELSASTRTAQLAADAVGAPLGSIVKSLIFIAADDQTILALVAGDQRADAEKIAGCIGAANVRMANGEEVRARTSFAIGGVPPVGHSTPLNTLVDATLLRFEKLWAAAGAPNALFAIETQMFVTLTQGRVAEIVV
jgi:prolyl-tRNA editing enzyme YbaK/EbsC (Cys-tRNA(Pro) deacylase)